MKMYKKILIFFFLALLIISGWFFYRKTKQPQMQDNNQNQPSVLTYEQAREIAQQSDCVKEGKLTDKYFYNENSKTWWIDLDLEKPGCAPACVIWEESKTAEINWRCTGLLNK